jgi:hypothetical protein
MQRGFVIMLETFTLAIVMAARTRLVSKAMRRSRRAVRPRVPRRYPLQ